MKNNNTIKQFFILPLALALLVSCSDKSENKQNLDQIIKEGNVVTLKKKKQELLKLKNDLDNRIEMVSVAISEKDSTLSYVLVDYLELEPKMFKHSIEILGSVKTNQNVIIASEYSGVLKKIYCKRGQYVKKGTVLAKIEDGGFANQLEQIRIQLELAETTFKRQERLWEEKVISEIDYLKAKAEYLALDSNYKSEKMRYKKTFIKAPFSGIIDDIITQQGSSLNPGTSVFRIMNLNKMYTEIDVPEEYLPNIKEGMDVEVFIAVTEEVIKTKVREVGNFIDPNNRTFRVEVEIKNPKGHIKPNLTAKVKIHDYVNDLAIVLPDHLVQIDSENQKYVYLIKSIEEDTGIIDRALISVGKSEDGFIEITSGLSFGDIVVTEGARMVKLSQKVTLVQSGK